jgi:hypothetical protein
MKQFLFISLFVFFSNLTFSQKKWREDVVNENKRNIMNLSLGITRESANDIMGGIKEFKIKNQEGGGSVFNPSKRDLKYDSSGTTIEVLWYVTDFLQKAKGGLYETVAEETPLVFENNKLIGIGWGFYIDYSKKKQIEIKLN